MIPARDYVHDIIVVGWWWVFEYAFRWGRDVFFVR